VPVAKGHLGKQELAAFIAGWGHLVANTCDTRVLQEGSMMDSLVHVMNDTREGGILYKFILKFLAVA